MNDITITKNKESATDQSRGADVFYQYDEELKGELTWSKVCEQLDKPRFKDTGIRKSRFSMIRENLSNNRR